MGDDDLDALVDRWGEGNVAAAFWLQEHIKDQGLDGIEYMEAGRNYLRSDGDFTVTAKMRSALDNKY